MVARLSALSSTTLAGFVLGCWERAHDAHVQTAAQGSRNRHGGGDVDGAGRGPGRVRGAGVRAHRGHRPAGTVCLPAAQATLAVLLNTGTGRNGAEPGTLFGEAVTKIVSPGHVFNLPAQPAARWPPPRDGAGVRGRGARAVRVSGRRRADPADRLLVRQAPHLSGRVAEVRATTIDDALAAALGDSTPEQLEEVTGALDVLARHLSPRTPARPRP